MSIRFRMACLAAVGAGLCRLPADLGWRHVPGAGILGYAWLRLAAGAPAPLR